MKEVFYALQFKGHGGPAPDDPSLIRVASTATSSSIVTGVDVDGVSGHVLASAGEGVACQSEVAMTGENSFRESGTIVFGNEGHSLRFASLGEGYIGPAADPKLRQGAVISRIEEGKGQFEGATGLITSNFTVTERGDVVDHQFGVIFVK